MLVTALVSLAFPLHAAAPQDTVPVLVRVEDRARVGARNRVVVRNRQGADTDIYRSGGTIPGDVALSPDGRYVSFVEVVGDERRPERRLVIIQVSGTIVRTIADRPIVRHVWCCADRIAVILGRDVEGGVGFMPEGVSVLDVLTGLEQPVDGVSLPYELYWAAFDSSLYIKAFAPPGSRGPDPVYRYHAPTGGLSLTTRRGAFFSPDGRYYFNPSIEGSAFRLYRSSDDQEVTGRLQLPAERVKDGPEFGWVPGAGHTLLFIDRPSRTEPRPGRPPEEFRRMDRNVPQLYPNRWNLVVDAETGRVVDRFQGDLGAGWRTNSRALPIERRAGVELVPPRRP